MALNLPRRSPPTPAASQFLGNLPPELIEAAEMEGERRRKFEPLRYFKMNPAVERYARAWCDPRSLIVTFPASNAIGKTWSTVVLLGWTIWPEFVPEEYGWFKIQIIQKIKKLPIDHSFRICSTPNEVAEVGSFQKAIKTWWPSNEYTTEKVRKPFPSTFKVTTPGKEDWFGDVMTYEQDPAEFEGATRGIFIYNEPPPRAVRQACVQRTRMGGMEVFPMTPLEDAAYIKDEIVDKAPQSNGQIQVVTGEMEDACKEHSKNGHLDHKRIEYLIGQMDPDERDARSKGHFMHLQGVILKKFNRAHFVSPTTLDCKPIYPQFQCIDPSGFHKPFAILWGQVVPEPIHALHILREWPNGSLGEASLFEKMKNPDMKEVDYAKLFHEVETSLLGHPAPLKSQLTRIMDKRFGNVQDITSGLSMRDRFSQQYGYDFQDSYSVGPDRVELRDGIQAINNYLEFDPLSKKVKILIDPSCINLIRAIERWALDPKTHKPKDDVWKNFVDVLRYICAHGFTFSQPISDADWGEDAHQPFYGRQ